MPEIGRGRGLWLPVLVGITGALLSVAGWGVLVAERRALILDTTAQRAMHVRQAVELHLAQQLEALRGLGELWNQVGSRSPSEWRAYATQRMRLVPGLGAVAWIDLDEPGKRIDMGEVGAQGPAIEVADAEDLRHREHAAFEGPRRDASGRVHYRAVLPLRAPGDHAGVLVARFGLDPVLESVLRGRAPGYALTAFWEGDEVFSRGTPSSDPWQQWWRVEEKVPVPLGGQWRVELRPTPEFAAERLPPVTHYLLAAGLMLSLVLAVMVHELRVIARQSRFLAVANRALERRGQALESDVADRTEALEEAVSDLETINYSVSHDLRSPLGAILNFCSILEEDYRDRPMEEEGQRLVARIRRSASRANNLLEDLLGFSRVGRTALDLETIDMEALARETFAQVRAAAEDAEVEVLIDPLPEACGDRVLVGNVFANLFTNALKYSRGCEKGRVHVSGREDDAECVYEVSDTGRGFDPSEADRLFRPFERLHPDAPVEGTGVGLAIVARIVRRHGGRVWAEGRPGEGARFGFSIPKEAPSR